MTILQCQMQLTSSHASRWLLSDQTPCLMPTLTPPPSHCRADWKACAASKAEEEARTEKFKELFKPYDIMQ